MSDVLVFNKSEQKFINYHQKLVKRENKKVYDEKIKMANICQEKFVKKFRDELFKVGFSPDQVSSKIDSYESAIITISDVWIMAQADGNIGRNVSFFIMKRCRNDNGTG